MPKTKYFDKIRADQAYDAAHPGPAIPPFDFEALGPATRTGRVIQRLIEHAIPILLCIARRFFPIFRFQGFYWITRHADVVAALADDVRFGVPYGLEMRELSRGVSGEADFVLGVDGDAQRRQNAIIRRVILPGDLDRVRSWARAFAESLIEGGAGRLDVVGDFAIRVPTEICRRYFGLSFADPGRSAEWAMAISALLFADPTGDKAKRRQGLAGAARLRRIIDAAITHAGGLETKGELPNVAAMTLVERLVSLARDEPDLALGQAEIRAIILGLVVGFIPTNGLAAAKMLELLLARRGAFDHAVAAAVADDRDAMCRVVREAGRLNPALSPGQWRYAHFDVEIGGKKIPAGATVMISTMSAMRDRRAYAAPGRFDPDADNDSALVFGHGVHACIGEHLASEIITEMFVPLFARPRLRRARGRDGRMQRTGYFPRRLDVVYDTPAATQSMIIAAIPIASSQRAATETALADLGNPAAPLLAQRLDATNILHFASAVVVDAASKDEPARPTLLVELNVDGARDAAIGTVAKASDAWLAPLLRAALPGDERSPAAILRDHCFDLHFRPWGATGLNFFGTGDFPVSAIARQQRLRERATALLGDHLTNALHSRAMLTMAAIRRGLRVAAADADLDAFLVQPMRKQLPLSRWRKHARYWDPLGPMLREGLGRQLILAATATILLFMAATHLALAPARSGFGDGWWEQALGWGLYTGLLFLVGLLAASLSWAAVAGTVWLLLRRAEDREVPDDAAAPHAMIERITAIENHPLHIQNHITAVTPLKPGLIRRLALAFALWGIRQSLHWFRPGYVVTMGTIHYAKWFRLPGSDKLIFQSNYDGSWESYLEDFITRAHQGQTAAWSSGAGFPRSRALINEGARDGDRFKRWVRRQQVPTAFWYSRFPQLTTAQIRDAALIHDGLARAQTDTAARAWLDLIGSAQRQPYELESHEIQSILFRGLKRARYTACLPIRLPDTLAGRGRWFDKLLSGADGLTPLSFGKFPSNDCALYLALSPSGIRRIGEGRDAAGEPIPLLESFPSAFAIGMANRGRVLRDAPSTDSDVWRWRDADGEAQQGAPVADAVLIAYARTPDEINAIVDAQYAFLRTCGGAPVHPAVLTVALGDDGNVAAGTSSGSYEHFRFRDGISSPVIRGTEKFNPRREPEDIVEPGEFILGYPNNQGYFAPSIDVEAASDTAENLPIPPTSTSFGFADFQNADEQFAARDFGRNGCFLVLRDLAQDVDGFDNYCEAEARRLNLRFGVQALREAVGETVSRDWIAAKLMGRWRDGRPLVGNPTHANLFNDGIPDNDFAFGRDDPRGHACPLGAHIRRAHPRDSLNPDDPVEREITSRHLMIRRGRTYFYNPEARLYSVANPPAFAERGLLFAALCADLERQFEMVQQSWLGAPAFHGLNDESDPITQTPGLPSSGRFTIPTPSGPIMLENLPPFVTLKGGGYFFLPSRSAIAYLGNLSRNALVEQF